jgi:hydroxymethylbilane synthase
MRSLVIGTRGSSLALCQAEIVRARLEERFPDQEFRLQTIKAEADAKPDVPLIAMGGEGIFVKELEAALLEERIDLAVHSLKDLPLATPSGLCLAAILERDEPRDALVSASGAVFERLPSGARVGTSSLRRRSQLLSRRNDLQPLDIRGNVDTRLRKLDEGRYDAIVIAACGLFRLGLEERITEHLDFSVMLPEPGQGALAVEARIEDRQTLERLRVLDDPTTRAAVEAERAFLQALGGGCRVPIAAYAALDGGTLKLEGAVIAPDGSRTLRGHAEGPMTEPLALGSRLAQQLISQGALDLLKRGETREPRG